METRTDSTAAAEGIVVAEFGVRVVCVFGGREIVIDVSVGDILNIGWHSGARGDSTENSEQLKNLKGNEEVVRGKLRKGYGPSLARGSIPDHNALPRYSSR